MKDKKILKTVEGIGSFYDNVRAKQNVPLSIAEFVTRIRNGRWKAPVEQYRRLKAEKQLAQAEQVKNRMSALA